MMYWKLLEPYDSRAPAEGKRKSGGGDRGYERRKLAGVVGGA